MSRTAGQLVVSRTRIRDASDGIVYAVFRRQGIELYKGLVVEASASLRRTWGRKVADDINLEVSPFIRNGFFALKRDGHVVEHGRMPFLSRRYQPGDLVLISADTAKGIGARLAQLAEEGSYVPAQSGIREFA
jgi:hypothetical protein